MLGVEDNKVGALDQVPEKVRSNIIYIGLMLLFSSTFASSNKSN